MYDSGNNVIGFEYSQLSEISETLKPQESIMKITLSYEWAVNLYKKAIQFGYKIALDEPHGGYSWHIHLLKNGKRINGIHIQVVKSVWDY